MTPGSDLPVAPPRSPFRADPHDREILRLAVPALGALLAEPLYLLADTAVVGHLGTEALAGLAAASTVLLALYSIFIFLAYGTTAAVARLLGAGHEADAAHQAVQSLWLATAIGVVLALVGLPTAEPLLRLVGASGLVLEQGLIYLRVSLAGLPALLLVLAGTGYLRGRQDTRTPLVVAVVSAVANLVLELVWIFGLGFGIGASALATVVAQWGAALAYVAFVARAVQEHAVPLRPHGRTIGGLARVGGNLFVRTVALRGAFTIATAVAARIGTVALAAHQIAFQIWNALALGLDAIAIAGQALVGRYLGAADAAAARAAGRRMLEWGVGAGVVTGLAVAATRTVLPGLFTNDPAVLAVTAGLLLWAAAMQPVNGPVFVLDGLLIGAGDLRFLAWAMVLGLAVFAPAAGFVLVGGYGIEALWAALALFMLTRLVALGWRWHDGRWAVEGVPTTS